MVTRSNDTAFCEAAKCLNFSGEPASHLTFNMTFPFLPKEVLPFNVKVRGKLPSM